MVHDLGGTVLSSRSSAFGNQVGGDSAKRIAAGDVRIGLSILSSEYTKDVLSPLSSALSALNSTERYGSVQVGRSIHSVSFSLQVENCR